MTSPASLEDLAFAIIGAVIGAIVDYDAWRSAIKETPEGEPAPNYDWGKAARRALIGAVSTWLVSRGAGSVVPMMVAA